MNDEKQTIIIYKQEASMASSKAWFASKGVWGSIVSVASVIVGVFFHVKMSGTQSEALVDALAAVGTLVGAFMSGHGRIVAKGPIRPSVMGKDVGPAAWLIAATVVFALSAPAVAADAPQAPTARGVRAQLLSGFPYNGSGLYWGIGSMAVVAQPSFVGGWQGSMNAFGGAIGPVIGYQFGNGNVSYAVELAGYYNALAVGGGCNGITCDFRNRWSIVQRFKAMTPISKMLGWFPNLSLPDIPVLPKFPAGVTALDSHVYLMASIHEDEYAASLGILGDRVWRFSPGVGVGIITLLSNHVAADLWAEYVFPAAGFQLGNSPITVEDGRRFVIGGSLLY